jgi:hypothetical protein
MFMPRSAAKVLMIPGGTQGETNGLYAAVTVNTNPSRMGVIGGQQQVTHTMPTIRRQRTRSLLGFK